MPVYIALLRGINIGPHKRMKMEKLRASCEGLKLERVKTYVQSGNVVFRAAKQSPARLAKNLEAMIVHEFGFTSTVVIRTDDEIGAVIRNNPFRGETGIDESRFCVAFLSAEPAAGALKRLSALPQMPEQSHPRGDNVYLYYPNGFAKTKLTTNFLEKVLDVDATIRNWRTVNSLHAMAQECQ